MAKDMMPKKKMPMHKEMHEGMPKTKKPKRQGKAAKKR